MVIDAALGLINIAALRRVAVTSRLDFAAYLAAMLVLLFVSVVARVLVGVVLSLLLLIATVSKSPVRRMAFDEQHLVYVNAEEHPDAMSVPGVLIVEIDGPLFFADANNVRDAVRSQVAKQSPSAVVLDLGPVTLVDLDGADILT